MQLNRNLFASALRAILRPIASFCVRRSIRFQDFLQIAKIEFIEAARQDLARQGAEESVSRLSAMTGLQRKDIGRLVDSPQSTPNSASLLARVLGLWQSSKRYTDAKGHPRSLTFEGTKSEFAQLVENVSSDLNHHTVLFELERQGNVLRDSQRGVVSLKEDEFITNGDPETAYQLLSSDLTDLITIVEQNTFLPDLPRNLHGTTSYDNISEKDIPRIRRWLLAYGRRSHREVRRFLSAFDLDIGKRKSHQKGGWRVVFGTFGAATPPQVKSAKEAQKEQRAIKARRKR